MGVSLSPCPNSHGARKMLLTAIMPRTVLQCEMPFGIFFPKYKVFFIK